MINATPSNTHYFFASFNQGQEETEVLALQERFDQFLLGLDEDEQDFWTERIHFVTESPWEADGISTFLNGLERCEPLFDDLGFLFYDFQTWEGFFVWIWKP